MKIRLHYEPSSCWYGLYIFDDDGAAKPVEMISRDRFESRPSCVNFDDKQELQDLIDDLWSIGLRPSARPDEYKAQLHTMNNHLNDMRTLVFKERNDLTIGK